MGESDGREKRNPSEESDTSSTKKVARQLDLDFKGFVTNHRTPLLSQPFLSFTPRVKLESPNLGQRPNVEAKDSIPKKQNKCNCKNSRCLKLYCECFALGIYCDGCNCVNCHNNIWNETERQNTIDVILERDPNAFSSKIDSIPYGNRDDREEIGTLGKHKKGCNCKKSGSDERQALFQGEITKMSQIQQAANAAINGAIGSSGFGSPPLSKKTKVQEPYFMIISRDHYKISQQVNAVNSLTPPPLYLAMELHLAIRNSCSADIIQPQDVKELCSVLVKFSQEATKAYADLMGKTEKQPDSYSKGSLPTLVDNRLESQKEADGEKAEVAGCISRQQADYSGHDDSGLDADGFRKSKPMSPGTLFRAAACSDGIMDIGGNFYLKSLNRNGATKVYTEQERLVLTKFRDCLNWLITEGDIREKDCSLAMMRSDSGIYDHSMSNGTPIGRTNSSDLRQQACNGIKKPVAQPTGALSHSNLMSSPASNHVQQLKLSSLNSNGNLKPKIGKRL